ncbi:type II secretion system protein [Sulfurirhabdus autotrophica]|uniref:Prepilin-type N-terminal cleavage/methylation domain-containing protein n=1 Tax=Sulfurirhabdus autotrophica TaxID=1706046 RepID=A0A4R3XR08_9PROT|nr:prepilin-type N-terminal cleavage/methylation domain-containing protein [Sulfurirhabdus autotrophica]TCV80076.1 prepilin-type N-terminal cleavage/methylation domain-containing protein [Sulfurirhabdus autotrophica]
MQKKQLYYLSNGFTLIEIAITLFIITLLLGGLLVPLGTQIEQRKISETQRNLEEIKEAMIGFALANGRLPRPANSNVDGNEKAVCTGANASAMEQACTGFIPWATLGVPKLDAWGKVFRYSVTPAFANSSITFVTTSTKTVQTRDATGSIISLASSVPAVIISQGKNNWGIGDNGNAFADTSATNTDEDTNNSASVTFISRTQTDSGTAATGGEFDDLVAWISPNILFSRMVAAGKLP